MCLPLAWAGILAFAVSTFQGIQASPCIVNKTYSAVTTSLLNGTLQNPPKLAPSRTSDIQSIYSEYAPESTAYSSPESQPTQPAVAAQPALLPAVHWNHDKTDLQNLAPGDSHELYYSTQGVANPLVEHVFAQISTNMSHPSVVLEHSDYVQSVVFKSGSFDIKFKTKKAFEYAKTAWSSVPNFVLVTNIVGCGNSTDQRSFWLIDHLKVHDSDLSIIAVTKQELNIEDAIQDVDMIWGTYKPNNSSALFNSSSSHGPDLYLSDVPHGNQPDDCGTPPASEIDGFPTAPCGSPDFDQQLDNTLGSLDFDDSDYSASLRAFAPGLEDFSASDNQGFEPPDIRRRSIILQRRNWFTNIANKIVDIGRALGNEVVKIGQQAVNGLKSVGNAVLDATTISPEIATDIPIDVKPPSLVDSPWGPALQIFKKENSTKNGLVTGEVAVYCVGCGVNGKVHIAGQARWNIVKGLEKLNVGMNGNIAASLQLGLNAQAKLEKTLTFPIAQTGVPGFSVSGIITVGPVIKLDAEAGFGVSLEGQVLAGIKMTIPNFSANLDLVDGSKSESKGFTPRFEKIFEAKAKISATVALGLPLSIGIGIIIPPIKFDKTAVITDKPSAEATISYTASTSCDGINGDKSCVNGISYNIDLKNDIYADIFGLKKFDLFAYKAAVASGCIPVGSQTCSPSNTSNSSHPTLSRRSALDRDDIFSFVDSSDENAPADDPEFESLSDAALSEASHENQTANVGELTGVPDAGYITINNVAETYSLDADINNGNLYIARAGRGSYFSEVSGIVVGDDDDRFFHYYPDVMKAYNVSRLRLSSHDSIPKGAGFVALAPVDYDHNTATPSYYAGFDTTGSLFFTISCDIRNQASKVFLATDPVQGIKTLKLEKLRYTVTGGVVSDCYYMPWKQSTPLTK